jgi:hypothetical protein
MPRQHRWLICGLGDATLCAVLGWLLEVPFLYALAPLSFPLWARVDSRPQGRAFIDRLFGR